MQSLVKIKPLPNDEVILLFTSIGKSGPSCGLLTSPIMSFNAIHENKILAKISEFTVIVLYVLA